MSDDDRRAARDPAGDPNDPPRWMLGAAAQAYPDDGDNDD